ncbi:MAG: hypothetical protein H7196_02960 [candidate division SR1 bacterium]|nr:hypothetical protein [candidate division SR1 bacterium]
MFQKFLRLAFFPVIIIILTTATTFVLLQQNIRLGADEEISTLSDNIITAVEKNRAVLDNQPQDQLVDPTKSDLIFIQAYNDDNSLIFSTLGIDGNNQSKVPQGVLDTAKKNGRNNVTWSPKKDIRLAVVIQRFNGEKPGFIVTGRSLKTFDAKVYKLGKIASFATLISIALVSLISAVWAYIETPREKRIRKIIKKEHNILNLEKVEEENILDLEKVESDLVDPKPKKHIKAKSVSKKK